MVVESIDEAADNASSDDSLPAEAVPTEAVPGKTVEDDSAETTGDLTDSSAGEVEDTIPSEEPLTTDQV